MICTTILAAEDEGALLLGDTGTLMLLIVLAIGGALLIGNLAALLVPRRVQRDGELVRAPALRSLLMAATGLVASAWSLATLLS